jgi:ABC-type uncharacterized transport system permease subunit
MSKRAALILAIVVGGGIWVAFTLSNARDLSQDASYNVGYALMTGIFEHPLIALGCVAVAAVAMVVVSRRKV